jgi:hypothetical protein
MPVPDFSPGEVLTAAAMDSIGLWLVKTQTIGTAVPSVTVTSAFSADYDTYKIVVNSGVGSTAANIGFTLGASATGYYSGGAVYNYATAGGVVTNDNNAASWSRAGQMDTGAINLDITVIDPFLAKITKTNWWYALPSTTANGGMSAGFHNVATSYSAFTITCGSGTMTGGTIRVYGYRK